MNVYIKHLKGKCFYTDYFISKTKILLIIHINVWYHIILCYIKFIGFVLIPTHYIVFYTIICLKFFLLSFPFAFFNIYITNNYFLLHIKKYINIPIYL